MSRISDFFYSQEYQSYDFNNIAQFKPVYSVERLHKSCFGKQPLYGKQFLSKSIKSKIGRIWSFLD